MLKVSGGFFLFKSWAIFFLIGNFCFFFLTARLEVLIAKMQLKKRKPERKEKKEGWEEVRTFSGFSERKRIRMKAFRS